MKVKLSLDYWFEKNWLPFNSCSFNKEWTISSTFDMDTCWFSNDIVEKTVDVNRLAILICIEKSHTGQAFLLYPPPCLPERSEGSAVKDGSRACRGSSHDSVGPATKDLKWWISCSHNEHCAEVCHQANPYQNDMWTLTKNRHDPCQSSIFTHHAVILVKLSLYYLFVIVKF